MTAHANEDVEKSEHLFIAGGNKKKSGRYTVEISVRVP